MYHTWNNKKTRPETIDSKYHDGLPSGSSSISNIKGYFEFVIEKYETLADKPPVQI